MDREDAIKYLQKKHKISQGADPKFNDKEEEEISNVVKSGKIYGDPIVEVEW